MTQFFPPHLSDSNEKYYRRGKKIPKWFYRITTKAIVMNKKWQILILREGRFSDKKSEFYRDDAGLYDLPGRGLDYGEDFREGLFRELREEIWLDEKYITISDEPLYIQVTELDDRYFDDLEKDDFYPVVMMYYPVKLTAFDFHDSPECTSYEWVSLTEYKHKPIWTHSASLGLIFKQSDFPKEYIS